MKRETTVKTYSSRVEMAVNEGKDKFEQVEKQIRSDLVHSHTYSFVSSQYFEKATKEHFKVYVYCCWHIFLTIDQVLQNYGLLKFYYVAITEGISKQKPEV